MRRAVRFLRQWWQATVAIVAMVTALTAMAFAYPSLKRTQDFAQDGKVARDRQCALYPISLKMYAGAAKYGILTPEDLATYRAAAPRGCRGR
jgi:hypothetical protein